MIKKADVFIILFVFIIILLVYSATFFNKSAEVGEKLNIYVDGKLEYSYSLPLYEKKVIELNNEYGYNRIIAENNSVYMEESDCKGKDCVNIGKIQNNGDFIICAPHRIIVRIENEKTEEFDAVTY